MKFKLELSDWTEWQTCPNPRYIKSVKTVFDIEVMKIIKADNGNYIFDLNDGLLELSSTLCEIQILINEDCVFPNHIISHKQAQQYADDLFIKAIRKNKITKVFA